MNKELLPWRVTALGEKKGPREIVKADGSTVAKLTALDIDNANFIVDAVNRTAQPASQQLINIRDAITTAWRAGYWHTGYTHDSAYADEQAEKCADALLADEPQYAATDAQEQQP